MVLYFVLSTTAVPKLIYLYISCLCRPVVCNIASSEYSDKKETREVHNKSSLSLCVRESLKFKIKNVSFPNGAKMERDTHPMQVLLVKAKSIGRLL